MAFDDRYIALYAAIAIVGIGIAFLMPLFRFGLGTSSIVAILLSFGVSLTFLVGLVVFNWFRDQRDR